MRHDSRLPRVLHVLLHLEGMSEPATSEMLGRMLNTNGVVVRRTMAGLRDNGYVRSTKGHGGGWTLCRPLAEISLLELYEALGSPSLLALGRATDAPECLLERAANKAVDEAFREAERVFRASLANVTVAQVVADFDERARPDEHER